MIIIYKLLLNEIVILNSQVYNIKLTLDSNN